MVVLLSGGRDSVVPAGRRRPDRRAGRGQRAARELRPAAGVRRRRGGVRGALPAARRSAAGRAGRRACGRRQPPGLGARRPLRSRGARSPRAQGPARRRPHDHRPGRDDPLPPRRLARPARAARHAGTARPADPPAARRGRQPRGDRRVVRGARAAWVDDASNDVGRVHARRGFARGRSPRCASCTRPPRRTCCAPPSCCATRPRCSTS